MVFSLCGIWFLNDLNHYNYITLLLNASLSKFINFPLEITRCSEFYVIRKTPEATSMDRNYAK